MTVATLELIAGWASRRVVLLPVMLSVVGHHALTAFRNGHILDHMIVINVSSLKAHLSEKLAQVREGESLVVTDRRTPIASIVPYGTDNDRLIERKAEGTFHAVRTPLPAAANIDAGALLAADRGER